MRICPELRRPFQEALIVPAPPTAQCSSLSLDAAKKPSPFPSNFILFTGATLDLCAEKRARWRIFSFAEKYTSVQRSDDGTGFPAKAREHLVVNCVRKRSKHGRPPPLGPAALRCIADRTTQAYQHWGRIDKRRSCLLNSRAPCSSPKATACTALTRRAAARRGQLLDTSCSGTAPLPAQCRVLDNLLARIAYWPALFSCPIISGIGGPSTSVEGTRM